MNLVINSKFIQIIWWIIAPLLVAKIFISFGLLFLDTTILESLHVTKEKITPIYKFPKILSHDFVNKQKITTKVEAKSERLEGIVLSACYIEKNKNFIVIQDNSKTFFIDLSGKYKNAKLVEITINSATFLRNGKYFKLLLEKNKMSKDKINSNKKTSGEINNGYATVQRDEFKKYTRNIRQALRDIRVQEIRKNRKFAGLRLSFIRRGSFFDKMGLKKDDIIKSVDGKNLNSIMDLLPYYNQLDNTTTLQIGFERNKQMKEITYEIN